MPFSFLTEAFCIAISGSIALWGINSDHTNRSYLTFFISNLYSISIYDAF